MSLSLLGLQKLMKFLGHPVKVYDAQGGSTAGDLQDIRVTSEAEIILVLQIDKDPSYTTHITGWDMISMSVQPGSALRSSEVFHEE